MSMVKRTDNHLWDFGEELRQAQPCVHLISNLLSSVSQDAPGHNGRIRDLRPERPGLPSCLQLFTALRFWAAPVLSLSLIAPHCGILA